MFVTYKSDGVDRDTRILWRVVHRSHHDPFFNVVFSTTGEKGKQSLALVEGPEDLIALGGQKGTTILEVGLITPGYINGSDHWMMGPLREIWGTDDEENASLVYVLMDGTRYSSRSDKRASTELSGMRRIFEI